MRVGLGIQKVYFFSFPDFDSIKVKTNTDLYLIDLYLFPNYLLSFSSWYLQESLS